MTSNEHLLFGADQSKAYLESWEVPHKAGNPFALLFVLKHCRDYQRPLPDWASVALTELTVNHLTGKASGTPGRSNSTRGRYRNNLKMYVRARAYRSIMRWARDPRFYRKMPTHTIRLWFEGGLERGSVNSEKAIDLVVEALADTFAACDVSTVKKQRYYDPAGDLSVRSLSQDGKDIELPQEVTVFFRDESVLEAPDGLELFEALDLPDLRNIFGPPEGALPQHAEKEISEQSPQSDDLKDFN